MRYIVGTTFNVERTRRRAIKGPMSSSAAKKLSSRNNGLLEEGEYILIHIKKNNSKLQYMFKRNSSEVVVCEFDSTKEADRIIDGYLLG